MDTTAKRFYRQYSVTQQYGGPEEGGWHYQSFNAQGPVYEAPASVIVPGLVEFEASHPLKLPQTADNCPDYWDGDAPVMPWDDEAPTPKLYAWLVQFGTRTQVYDPDGPDLNERIIGYDCTSCQRVVYALSMDDLTEDLGAGYDPETDEAPEIICQLPDEIALAVKAHDGLVAALKVARGYIPQRGTMQADGDNPIKLDADIEAVLVQVDGALRQAEKLEG